MSSPTAPAMSVVMVSRDGIAGVRPILSCLSEQTIADQLQICLVTPQRYAPVELPAELHDTFLAFSVAYVDVVGNRGRAAASGVRIAEAPIIAFTEHHCFPDPNWAEVLVAAFDRVDDGVVGVGPAIANANPETLLSWTIYGAGYAAYTPERPARMLAELPIHNASYRRSALLPLDNELEDLMADERLMQRRLVSQGGQLAFQPETTSRHINEATWHLVLGMNWVNGRRYGGERSEDWPWLRRLAYAALFPLLSLSIMRTCMERLRHVPATPANYKMFGPVFLQSLAHAAGEAAGYLFGPKRDFQFIDDEEFMLRERLAGVTPRNPRIAGFVALAAAYQPR